MSAISCTCGSGVNGFGLIDCFGKPSRVVGLGFQQLKSGGVDNYLQIPVAQADWEGSLWDKDGSLRISVLNDIKEYASERDDAITETIDDIDYYLKDGKKMISFSVIGAPYKLKDFVDGLQCGRNGFYGISESNQLLGKRNDDNRARINPIPIQKGTLYSKMIDATNSTFSKMMVTFQVDERFNDADFVYAPASEVTADLFYTEPMIQCNASATVDTSTTISVTLTWAASGVVSANGLEKVTDFDTASFFAIYNNTTAASVTVASIDETTPGTYELTFAAQTAGDDFTVSAGALAPFDFEDITGLVAL